MSEMHSVNQPLTLLVIPVLVVSLVLGGLFIKHHRAVAQQVGKSRSVVWKKLATKVAFFWFVNLVFMAVSVLHAGLFFALLEPEKGLLGLAPFLGFAVALTLDLASIVFMQARLSALRMHEKRSAWWYLFSIITCSGLSAFGNLAMSLQDFNPISLNHAGNLIQSIAPWLGVAFPLLIILISIAADKVLDIDPTAHLDLEAYRKLEQRRIAILIERNNFLEQQVEQDRRRVEIKQREKDSKRGKRGSSPSEKPASPTELEQVRAQLESLQAQIQPLQLAPSPTPLFGYEGQNASPGAPPTTSASVLGGQGAESQEQPLSATPGPSAREETDSVEVRFALRSLDRHPVLKQQVLTLFQQDPRAAPERIASLMQQQNGCAGITGDLVSSMLARLIPSADNGPPTNAPLDDRVNTSMDTFADTRCSAKWIGSVHNPEAIPIKQWGAELSGSEQEIIHIGEADLTPILPSTEQQRRPISDEPLTSQRTGDASDFKQESNQPPGSRANNKASTDQTAEGQPSATQEVPTPSVHGHLDGRERDHPVHRPPESEVNSTANAGADDKASAEQRASEPTSEPFTGHQSEQEEPTLGNPEVNTSPNTSVSSPAKTKRRSSKELALADKPRGEASQRVRRVLKKYPTISISQLSEKARVSRGYASQVRAQVKSEQQRDASSRT